MKRSHIIVLGIIAVAVAIIVSTAGDASSYMTFDEAYALAENGKSTSIHVVGELTKDSNGHLVGIQPSMDKMSFSFTMKDENNKVQNVIYNEPMPPDFKRSEKVVVIGSYKDQTFVADKILMKCPSKYKETTVEAEV